MFWFDNRVKIHYKEVDDEISLLQAKFYHDWSILCNLLYFLLNFWKWVRKTFFFFCLTEEEPSNSFFIDMHQPRSSKYMSCTKRKNVLSLKRLLMGMGMSGLDVNCDFLFSSHFRSFYFNQYFMYVLLHSVGNVCHSSFLRYL